MRVLVDVRVPIAGVARVALRGLLLLIVASSCSKLADLDGLSKDYGKGDAARGTPDGGQDQRSDRADTRDMSSTSDLADGSWTEADDATGTTDDAQDAGGGPDSTSAIDGDPSADAGGDDADPVCAPQAVNDATLELVSSPTSTTSCGYSVANLPRYYAAVDSATFGAALACGACIRISASNVDIEALVVNLGSGRVAVDRPRLGVNRAALSLLLPDGSTFVSEGIPWTYTSCSFPEGMVFTLQQGSSTTYAALLIQNHRYRIQQVEYRSGSIFKPLVRTTYNSWVAQSGMGAGPFTIRLTDVNGAVVEQPGIPLAIETPFQGQAQFPVCSMR